MSTGRDVPLPCIVEGQIELNATGRTFTVTVQCRNEAYAARYLYEMRDELERFGRVEVIWEKTNERN